MSYASDMVDDLRDRLNDATDTQVPFATKVRFLNRGQAAMYPKIYRLVQDTTLVLEDAVFEYDFPSGVGTGRVLGVELEHAVSAGRYSPFQRYDIVTTSLTAPKLLLLDYALPGDIGAKIRLTTADRLVPFVAADYGASQSVVYTGPAGSEELPVLYALALATARALDDRLAYNRMSAVQQQGAINPADLMQVSQFWFAQFELLLDRIQMVMPVARN